MEAGSSQGFEGLLELLHLVEGLVELNDGNVLFTSRLLGLDESGGVVDASDEAASDLGIEGARVAGLVNLENSLNPGDNFVR